MKNFCWRVYTLVKKEFVQIWQDKKLRNLIVVVPLVQMFLYVGNVTLEVRNLHLAILDYDKTYESRELISRFQDSPYFQNVIYFEDRPSMEYVMDLQKVEMCLVINNGFAAAIHGQEPCEVLVAVDGRNTNVAAMAAAYATRIVASYSALVTVSSAIPPDLLIRNRFNPELNWTWFSAISTICSLMLSVVITIVGISTVREKDMGTIDHLWISPLSRKEFLLGKTLATACIGVVLFLVISILGIVLYNVPLNGSYLMFFINGLLGIMALCAIGVLVACLCKNQFQASILGGLLLFAQYMTGGTISPVADMPIVVQYLTFFNPYRWFLANNLGIFLKDMSWITFGKHCLYLVADIVVCFYLADRVLKKYKDK